MDRGRRRSCRAAGGHRPDDRRLGRRRHAFRSATHAARDPARGRVAVAPDGVRSSSACAGSVPSSCSRSRRVRDDSRGDDRGGVTVLQPGAAEHRVGPGRFQVHRGTRPRRTRHPRHPVRPAHHRRQHRRRPGEPNLIFAEEWIDDVDSLVREFVGDAPARTSASAPAPGSPRGSPTGTRPGSRCSSARPISSCTDYPPADTPSRRARPGRPHPVPRPEGPDPRRIPGWLWRIAARLQLFHDPETLLGAAARLPDSTVALMLTPEDTENFAHHRGPGAVARLRAARRRRARDRLPVRRPLAVRRAGARGHAARRAELAGQVFPGPLEARRAARTP